MVMACWDVKYDSIIGSTLEKLHELTHKASPGFEPRCPACKGFTCSIPVVIREARSTDVLLEALIERPFSHNYSLLTGGMRHGLEWITY